MKRTKLITSSYHTLEIQKLNPLQFKFTHLKGHWKQVDISESWLILQKQVSWIEEMIHHLKTPREHMGVV